MHYMIVKWDPLILKYEIIHYSHSYDEILTMIDKYPRENGYVHLVDLAYLKAHEVLDGFQKLKEKADAKLATS